MLPTHYFQIFKKGGYSLEGKQMQMRQQSAEFKKILATAAKKLNDCLVNYTNTYVMYP